LLGMWELYFVRSTSLLPRRRLLVLAAELDAEGTPRTGPGGGGRGETLTWGQRVWACVRRRVLEAAVAALAPPEDVVLELRSGAADLC
jgi:hypothetical protein